MEEPSMVKVQSPTVEIVDHSQVRVDGLNEIPGTGV